ncbi:hypothetical protein KPC83_04460 [Collinsella sp. zg1085]|uniref:hypothetical protein n=1 Tax=Collinsella sp. zg1085 TaxID=2844380 RepID=UPI001C0DAF7A|nr:hypothetical protein [Collinsella sp. zg1085]QWT17104.1 hypothetical protein KPC83_04460 [Collinsella sp. zg1085]
MSVAKTRLWPVLRFELIKCFNSKWMFVALSIGILLALSSAIEATQYVYGLLATHMDYWSNMYSYSNWMVANCNARLSPTIFFYVVPLLVLIPYAWSAITERSNGFDIQVFSRSSKRYVLLSRSITAFCSGFACTAIPLLVNFAVLVLLMPSIPAIYEDWNVLGIFDDSFLSQLFYSAPLLYVAAMTLVDGALMGVWALTVFSLSVFIKNRVMLLTLPYVGLLGWKYFSGQIFTTLLIQGPSLNFIDDMQGTFYWTKTDPLFMGLQVLILLAVAMACFVIMRRRELIS